MPLAAMLSLSDEGISYQWFSNKGKVRQTGQLKWSEIEAIDAFKRDIFSYDLICIHLYPVQTGEPLEMDEDDPYWMELMDALTKYFPEIKPWPAWFPEVAFPAFATNLQRIYERK